MNWMIRAYVLFRTWRFTRILMTAAFLLPACKTTQHRSGLKTVASDGRIWWKEAVAYEIWPRSFKDSNGDGIGDLNGITSKLDYLKDLGVDVIWLSPVYKSPNVDGGYDIADYEQIMTEFGTMADWDALLVATHARGMKLIMDLVANHTSDEHQWFVESRRGKASPLRDYYIWQDGKDGHQPNNWASAFSESAWTLDPLSGQYYLHLYAVGQPDLNWKNPQMRNDMYATMTWWLDKGIDGFRMDAVGNLGKAEGFPPVLPVDATFKDPAEFTLNQPDVHTYLNEMNLQTYGNGKYDVMTVGELHLVTPQQGLDYVAPARHELDMLFQFEIFNGIPGHEGKWNLVPTPVPFVKATINKWQTIFHGKGWQGIFLGNHDLCRMVSRFGNDSTYLIQSATMLATMILTIEGTPFLYQGDELGMSNVPFTSLSDYKDVEAINFYKDAVTTLGMTPADALALLQGRSRDQARTPVQWDATPNAGFTTGKPWMAVNPNYTKVNAAAETADSNSVLNFYKAMIKVRKQNLALIYGDFTLVAPDDPQVFAYTRQYQGDTMLVVMNYSDQGNHFALPAGVSLANADLLISNYSSPGDADVGTLALNPYEARVYKLNSPQTLISGQTVPVQLSPASQMTVSLQPQAPSNGLYLLTTDATFPVNLSVNNGGFFANQPPETMTTSQNHSGMFIAFNYDQKATVTISLPANSPASGSFNLSLQAVGTGATANPAGTAAIGSAVVSGTLTSMDGIDVYNVSGLASRKQAYAISMPMGLGQPFEVQFITPGSDPAADFFGKVNHPLRQYNSIYMPQGATQIGVAYVGGLNVANPDLHYSFTITDPHGGADGGL